MLPTRWYDLLDRSVTPEGVVGLVRALGFPTPARVDPATRRALGLPEELEEVRVAPGPGTTRALVVHAPGARESGRELARVIAGRLTTRAPHLLWLLVVAAPARREVVVTAWRAAATARLAALVVDLPSILPSDVETLDALSTATEGTDLIIHARWFEILGREAISSRFFVSLQRLVDQLGTEAVGRATSEDRAEVALLHVSRLLFLSFLEARAWLDGDRRFLSRMFDGCMASGGGFQRRVLNPLFFGTLNTPAMKRSLVARAFGRIPFLNGGLFTRSAAETRARSLVLRDADWGAVLDDLLLRYRFTAAEETSEWQEAAIDPEMMGRAFESLMAARERRVSGAFFTPLALVERTVDTAIDALLVDRGLEEGTVARVVSGVDLDANTRSKLGGALHRLRLLDPACGTGAFLVHALDRLTRLRQAAGDHRSRSAVRRDVLARSVFGVDRNPTAVWLCELRLWLALVIDHGDADGTTIPPLPNLDHNIRCGDALSGGDFGHTVACATHDGARLRVGYARATGARKRSLGRELDRMERTRLLAWIDARLDSVGRQRRELLSVARGRTLFGGRRGSVAQEADALNQLRTSSRQLREQRRRVSSGGPLPFVFAAHFADAAAAGGFDLVVGNPPWVRVHHIPMADRQRWRREYAVFRDATWLPGARLARAGIGFGSQVDMASLFVERGVHLLRPGGIIAYLVPAKLWRSLAGGGVRRLLMERTTLVAMEDWSEAPAQFDAATYPSLVAARRSPTDGTEVRLAVHRGPLQVVWRGSRRRLPLDDSSGAPWIALPPDARKGFDALVRAGVSLAESRLGRITLGVKTGCNDAFLVRAAGGADGRIPVTDGTRSGEVEADCLRPVLRGESVRAWTTATGDSCLIYPHADDGRLRSPLPGGVRTWLRPWRSRLEGRSDARSARAWWTLFRLEGASSAPPRVVWADIGRTMQALVLPAGDRTVPLNTCYVLPARDLVDAHALAALLNSAVVDAWLGVICEPARGGYRRHLAWCMARLPVPDDWARARELLAPLGERGVRGAPVSRTALIDAVLDAYRLRRSSIDGLLAWMNH